MASATDDIPEPILDQAIDWLVKLHSGTADETVQAACQHWRSLDPLHEMAWQQLQQVEASFRRLPDVQPALAMQTLEQLEQGRNGRRQALKLLGLGTVGTGLGWMALQQTAWRHFGTDYVTAIGEHRRFTLADGTRLQLNTDSAVDIRFSALRRLVVLREGEIFIETGPDNGTPDDRPFWVQSGSALLQAVGAGFNVRQAGARSELCVAEGTVAIHLANTAPVRVEKGQQYLIDQQDAQRIENSPFDATAWVRGQLVTRQARLQALAAELARYRRGWLHCDPAVAELKVSGVFQLDELDRSLDALSHSLPVRIERLTRFWVRILPA
ncbi:FecR domain-containing protein [Azomonas macrocytogenes]|uniref:Ferric-dicitrate binding protein FerR (Iron transport regulator) n=1 Tax=Azomonas macrocytogenes TaxID=69962 RepID=A0A839T868_AZOMA|nr:FecR family protein [Azomonas macrocytogenes]MBB3103853.1 ferric-dicitrate binding protein FerR (iron transport regulator) [Azomonas macrocytogenes]